MSIAVTQLAIEHLPPQELRRERLQMLDVLELVQAGRDSEETASAHRALAQEVRAAVSAGELVSLRD